MFIYFIKLINSMHALGHIISNSIKVSKILFCFLEYWATKVITITNTKILDMYSFNKLLSSLIRYEQNLALQRSIISERSKENMVDFKSSTNKSSERERAWMMMKSYS